MTSAMTTEKQNEGVECPGGREAHSLFEGLGGGPCGLRSQKWPKMACKAQVRSVAFMLTTGEGSGGL